MVLILGVLSRTQQADQRVLRAQATGRYMTKLPAAVALGDQGMRLILPGAGGVVAKQERWVSHDVLKTRTILVNEGNRDRAMYSLLVSGR